MFGRFYSNLVQLFVSAIGGQFCLPKAKRLPFPPIYHLSSSQKTSLLDLVTVYTIIAVT